MRTESKEKLHKQNKDLKDSNKRENKKYNKETTKAKAKENTNKAQVKSIIIKHNKKEERMKSKLLKLAFSIKLFTDRQLSK